MGFEHGVERVDIGNARKLLAEPLGDEAVLPGIGMSTVLQSLQQLGNENGIGGEGLGGFHDSKLGSRQANTRPASADKKTRGGAMADTVSRLATLNGPADHRHRPASVRRTFHQC